MSQAKSSRIGKCLSALLLTSLLWGGSAFASSETFDALKAKFEAERNTLLLAKLVESSFTSDPQNTTKLTGMLMERLEKENNPLYASILARVICKIDPDASLNLVNHLSKRILIEVGNNHDDKINLAQTIQYILIEAPAEKNKITPADHSDSASVGHHSDSDHEGKK
ncbi:MAG: hypothetical protein K2W94_04125 [Alphaproteobacteria bacterium]|nr:hypothetical protein [Alphaproteobacteria bacterium]